MKYLLSLLMMIPLMAQAQIKVKDLPGSVPIQPGDYTIVDQSGNTNKATVNQLIGSVSGDCAIVNLVISCTKSNGTLLSPSATIDATNATNLTSGILPVGRIPTSIATSVESFGASPSAAASANNVAINAALAVGGLVTLNIPGTYTIACTTVGTTVDGNIYHVGLFIGSNTTLRMAPGVTLKCASGVNNPVLMQNLNRVAGDSNIVLEGGTYDGNYLGNSISHVNLNGGTGSWSSMIIWMQNVTNLRASGITLQGGFAGFGINHVTGGTFENIHCNDTGTAQGVNQGSYLWPFGGNTGLYFKNIYGQSNDDMIGLISDFDNDARFTNLMGGPGPTRDVIIDGVHGDTTYGTLNFVRIGPTSTTNTMSRVLVRNVTGIYNSTAIKIGSFGYSLTGQLNEIQIDGLNVTPNLNNGTATIEVAGNGNITSLSIDNFNATIPAGTTQKPFFKQTGGTLNRLIMSNLSFFDKNTTGASLQDIYIGSLNNGLRINNFEAQSAVSAGDGAFLTITSGVSIDTVQLNNGYTVRRKNLVSVVGSAGIGKSLSIDNMLISLPQSPSFNFATTGAIPSVAMNAVIVSGTGGGSSGFINLNGVTGTTLIQMQSVTTNQGASANVVRAGAELIRVQSLDTPVSSAILTPSRGDIILDSTNNGDPYEYNGSTWDPLDTVNAANLTGTLADARLSANVPLINAANVFTANQQISDTEPRKMFNQTGAAADVKLWDFDVASGVFTGRTRTDADGAGVNWLAVTRGATTAISDTSINNATNNPTFHVLGTGVETFGGPMIANFSTGGGSFSFNVTSANPFILIDRTGSGTDAKNWAVDSGTANTFNLAAYNDAKSTEKVFLGVVRASNVISTMDYGNSTDKPPHTFHGIVNMPDLASSSAATTGTVCWTTVTGLLNVDTTVACLASTRKIKQNIHPLDYGLEDVMRLQPVSYELKPEYNPMGLGHQVGLIAEDVAKVDPRLVALDSKGDPRGVRYMQMTAVLIKAIQQQQAEIEGLKKQIKALGVH